MARRFNGGTLIVATHNAGKLAEFAGLLAPLGVDLRSAADLGLPEPAETEESFVGNARIKAKAAARTSGLPALADDSGLCCDALGGAPGVRTADWAMTPAGRDDRLGMRRLQDALEAVGAPMPRRAAFHCALVLAWPDGSDTAAKGVREGQVVWPGRGSGGHGYDPVFQPDGHDRTLAEMTIAEKGALSHRARALRSLIAACFT